MAELLRCLRLLSSGGYVSYGTVLLSDPALVWLLVSIGLILRGIWQYFKG